MINYLAIAEILRPSSYLKAISIYKSEIKKFYKNNNMLKNNLKNMNIFLYTYFLIKYNSDVEIITNKYNKILEKGLTNNKLCNIGEKMLLEYSNSILTSQNYCEHELVDKALDYINKNYYKKLSLEDVADRLHISRNYLCSLFKEETGYKFCEYINIQRVNRAKELILENKKNLEYISYECGFNSQSHFCTTFKKFVGCTPKAYKKTHI